MTLVELATQRTFRSLRIRNYRLFFFGQLVSVSGTWMQQLAQDWLVLRLTGRPLPVGITTALQFAPVLLLGMWGGLVADRIDKRRLLLATQGVMGTLALALGVLTLTGAVRLWMIYLLALLLGCATSFDMPARQAFVTEMVGPDHLTNAVGLNSAVFNSARIIGPAAAGVLIAVVDIPPAFLINALSYLAVITSLLLMRPGELYRQPPVERSRGQVRDGLRYVWATPTLRSTLLLMGVVATLGLNFRVALPLLARFTFNGGPSLYGLLASMMACGSVIGALATASRAGPTRPLLLWSVTLFGATSLVVAVVTSPLLAAVVLVPLGFSSITWMSTANSTLQLGSTAEMRGRVMSIYGLLFLGSAPIGAMLVGWLSEHYGPRSSLVLGGVSSLAAAAVAAAADLRARRRARAGTAIPSPEAATATGSAGSDEAA
ncbi:MAG TPA: MFS transporter [Actinomycetota bacterium]|nr:MFS transporter [Actinomycetota bacterium]